MILVHTLLWTTLEFHSDVYVVEDRITAIEYALWTLEMIINFNTKNFLLTSGFLKRKIDWNTETVELEDGLKLEYDWGGFIIRWLEEKWYWSDFYCRFDKVIAWLESSLWSNI